MRSARESHRRSILNSAKVDMHIRISCCDPFIKVKKHCSLDFALMLMLNDLTPKLAQAAHFKAT